MQINAKSGQSDYSVKLQIFQNMLRNHEVDEGNVREALESWATLLGNENLQLEYLTFEEENIHTDDGTISASKGND